jgi:hypothetical protein
MLDFSGLTFLTRIKALSVALKHDRDGLIVRPLVSSANGGRSCAPRPVDAQREQLSKRVAGPRLWQSDHPIAGETTTP